MIMRRARSSSNRHWLLARTLSAVPSEGAISYFVGGDPDFPEDTGFALKRWVKVWYDNNAAENGIQIHGDIAITMGNVYLQNAAGDEVMVDKTFVFRLCRDGKLRLCVHKSALPYSPDR